VLLLRATLRQNRHEFAAALDDLARVLEVQPRNAQAWLTRAVILQVQGDYAQARQSCARLSRLAEPLVVAACIGNVMGLQGQGAMAERLLTQNLQSSPQADVQLRLWALTVLAELESRRGDEAAAEKHFQEALGLGVRDSYLLGAYADWLLDRGRMEDVRRLLQDETRTDGSLLRLALAQRGLGDPSLDHYLVDLKARFEAGRQRGDNSIHQREQARAMLYLFDQSGEALELALRNWAVQREPWDARLVLEAALAANKPEAARPVLDWLAETGLEDLRLAQLSERLGGISKCYRLDTYWRAC
jgi:tetratricopeptide (TPR) repeat protein